MKIAVILDDDGHFDAALLTDREKVIDILERSDDGGDVIEDMVEEMDDLDKQLWENRNIISDEKFGEVLRNFEQRGTFEILDI